MSTDNRSGVPFSWQDKRILRRIREQVEECGTALAVYSTLTVAASDKEGEQFQTTHQWLASTSGFGVPTVKRRLRDLQRIGVVEIVTPKLKAPCTYRLLDPDGNQTRAIARGEPALAHHDPALAHGRASAVSQIRRKEEKKGKGLSIPDKIDRRTKLEILRRREADLKYQTSEQWQCDLPEGKVARKELQKVRADIADLENAIVES